MRLKHDRALETAVIDSAKAPADTAATRAISPLWTTLQGIQSSAHTGSTYGILPLFEVTDEILGDEGFVGYIRWQRTTPDDIVLYLSQISGKHCWSGGMEGDYYSASISGLRIRIEIMMWPQESGFWSVRVAYFTADVLLEQYDDHLPCYERPQHGQSDDNVHCIRPMLLRTIDVESRVTVPPPSSTIRLKG